MLLNFYKIPAPLIKSLFDQGVTLFFYDQLLQQRFRVEAESFKQQLDRLRDQPTCYFQIPIESIKQIQDNEAILQVAEANKELLLYVDRFNLRKERYAEFYQPNWPPIPELAKAFIKNDFVSLANIIQADLSQELQDLSEFASSVSDCLEKMLRHDSSVCRILCFSYCAFRYLKYTDRALLHDFLGAALLKDLGLTQGLAEDIYKKNDSYFKHQYFSLFLLKKLPIELSPLCYFFILDHHEAQNGSGFPKQKMGKNYHPLCDVLKVSELIFLENANLNGYLAAMKRTMTTFENSREINLGLEDFLKVTCSYLAG